MKDYANKDWLKPKHEAGKRAAVLVLVIGVGLIFGVGV
jgi:hypothetical protein